MQHIQKFITVRVCNFVSKPSIWTEWRQQSAVSMFSMYLRGSEQTTMQIQKYAKSCCHKTTWAIILMIPIKPLTGSLRCACIYIAPRRLDYSTKEAVLSQRASKCSLHNSVKLSLCSPELDFSLFCDILGSGLDSNRYRLKSPWKLQSTYFCLPYNEQHSVVKVLS